MGAIGIGCGGILGMDMDSTTAPDLFAMHQLPRHFTINLLKAPAPAAFSNSLPKANALTLGNRTYRGNVGSSSATTNVGTMTLGGVPHADYQGGLACVPTLPPSQRENASKTTLNPQGVLVNTTKWWQVALTDVRVGDRSIGSGQAIVDTGTSPLAVSKAAAEALGSVDANCRNIKAMPDITFSFANGVEVSLGPEQYVLQVEGQCEMFAVNIPDMPGDGNFFVLGDPFFWKYLAVFDFETEQVGIALKKDVAGKPLSGSCGEPLQPARDIIV